MWCGPLCLAPAHRATIRTLTCTGALASLVLVAACSSESSASSSLEPTLAVPAEVRCEDAAEFMRHAADERNRAATLSSDQARISAGKNANFFAALSLAAHLMCRVDVPDGGAALGAALDTARSAEAAGGFYEASFLWNEATFHATQAISALIEQL